MNIASIRWAGMVSCALGIWVLLGSDASVDSAQGQDDPSWIWSQANASPTRPAGPCYFRKSFVLQGADSGRMEITCDQQYTLYVNGVKMGNGESPDKLDVYNIGPYLINGRNVIAVSAVKSEPGQAGLVARVTIQDQRGRVVQYSSDSTWKTSQSRQVGWAQAGFNDRRWVAAHELGPLGTTKPWGNLQARGDGDRRARFKVMREFRVEWVLKPEDTKSLLAITFDEFGNLLASRENGPLLVVRDTDEDAIPDTVATYCDEVKNCQGILALNGEVFVTADGPEGAALYRLNDEDRDGVIDTTRAVVKFKGQMQEHGPHALRLGPDGMIYIMCGNMTKLATSVSPSSPYNSFYEGDLVQPRYEDPRGHARGVKAPGSTVIRTDLEGEHVERFAGGLRNPYDFAFNREGELFTWDADMEWDQGMTWYRPTRVNHITAGAEFGWRSGWAKWPAYFIDSLPGILDTGNGSPTGMCIYKHFMFPVRYHNTLFVGDWTLGQILAIRLKKQGASYTAEAKTFVEGNPLNITDLTVGPDGWMYFCTGGRGTEGGVYRVVWSGVVPREVQDLGKGIEVALRQPQLDAAWARQRLALIKKQLGDDWGPSLAETAKDRSAETSLRLRAVDLMQLYGPLPTTALLLELSKDRDHLVRAKATYLMGVHKSAQAADRLIELLDDPDPVVQRRACESLARGGYHLPVDKLIAMLGADDRFLAWAASKALQTTPPEHWQEDVLGDSNQRVVLMGAATLLGGNPDRETCIAVIERMQEMTKTFVADRDFADLLRVCQIALHRGSLTEDDVPGLHQQIAAEFPAGNRVINRELLRILAYLESTEVAERVFQYFATDLDPSDKMHVALHAPHFVNGWNTEQRFEILEYFATARNQPGSPTYARYLDGAARDLVSRMTESERLAVLREAEKWPHAALGAIAKLRQNPGPTVLADLRLLDGRLAKREDDDAAEKLRTGIAAILARSQDAQAMEHLRILFDREPERRDVLAMGLMQSPDDKNWPYLVRALPVVEGNVAVEVIKALSQVNLAPLKPEPVRQVILHGLKQKHDAGRRAAINLLEKWSEKRLGSPEQSPEQSLAAWQAWFKENHPTEPEPNLPVPNADDRYTYEQLLQFVNSEPGRDGDLHRGQQVFTKAQCSKCHRFGNEGDGIGPDLTTVSRRFQRKEILQSILFPSHVISDQYATKTVTTADGRTFTGVVSKTDAGDVILLDNQGEQIQIAADEIDAIDENQVSSMPPSLLNELTMDEIADLFAYLRQPTTSVLSRRPRDPTR